MENSDEPNLIQVLINLISAYFKRLNDLFHLAELEARLAVKTLVNIIFLSFVLCMLIISAWLCALTMLFVYLVSLHFSLLSAACIITFVNIFLITAIVIVILKIKKNLFFPATRKHL